MSWTTATLLVNEGPNGYLGTFPVHSPKKARSLLIEKLDYKYAQSRLSNFDTGIRPPSGWFCVGAYDKAFIISGHNDLYGMGENTKPSAIRTLIDSFRDAEILYFELAGATGYFAFELYAGAELQRAMVGDPERGVVVNKGALTTEEQGLGLAGRSNEEFIKRGETMVFELTKRFLGVPFDRYAAEDLVVELIKKRESFISRFWH